MSVGSWNVLSQRSSLSRVAYSACGFLEGLRLGACQWPANGQQGKLQSFICEQDVISALIIARQAIQQPSQHLLQIWCSFSETFSLPLLTRSNPTRPQTDLKELFEQLEHPVPYRRCIARPVWVACCSQLCCIVHVGIKTSGPSPLQRN